MERLEEMRNGLDEILYRTDDAGITSDVEDALEVVADFHEATEKFICCMDFLSDVMKSKR